jgi:hypothetical protein
MATLTEIAETPGRGGKRPVQFGGPRVAVMRVYTFDFDNSYPTGGESIQGVFDDFQEIVYLQVQMPSYTAGTGKEARVDMAGKKLKLYDNAATPAEVANASDQSTITGVRLLAVGY